MEDEHIDNFNKWSNSYSVGINLLDEQHRELLSMIDSFCIGCFQRDEKSARKFFDQSVYNMVNYIKHHFSTEEKLLAFIDYPELVGHKQQHSEFLNNLTTEVRSFKPGETAPFRPWVQYLKDWLFTHITISDKKYGVFLQDLKKRTFRKKKLPEKTE
jgi:hemerythrin